jgi:hypothetical protein
VKEGSYLAKSETPKGFWTSLKEKKIRKKLQFSLPNYPPFFRWPLELPRLGL